MNNGIHVYSKRICIPYSTIINYKETFSVWKILKIGILQQQLQFILYSFKLDICDHHFLDASVLVYIYIHLGCKMQRWAQSSGDKYPVGWHIVDKWGARGCGLLG
jgi:hypothetical protein